jgi:hypothetical protein
MNQMFLFLRRQKENRPILLKSLRLFVIGLGFFLLPLLLPVIAPLLPSSQRTNIAVLTSVFRYVTIMPALAYWALAVFAPLGEMRNRALRNAND